MSNDVLSEVMTLIHAVFPDKWVVVPGLDGATPFAVYTKDLLAVVNAPNPRVSFVVINRSTGVPVTWGEADCSADALAIIEEWLVSEPRSDVA